ncbi:MAG: hypothetical protein IJW24_01370, partial [Clostridia bacterium]|nr:hypothetical protein [Clostridia bacterium]
RDCSVIVKVSIPDSLSVLGVAPFIGCCNVSSIQVDDNNLVFDDRGYAICGKQGTTNGGILYQGFEKTVIQD